MSPSAKAPRVLSCSPSRWRSFYPDRHGHRGCKSSPRLLQPTAKVDCLVFDNTGTKCELAVVVYAITHSCRADLHRRTVRLRRRDTASQRCRHPERRHPRPDLEPLDRRHRLRVGRVVRRQQGLPRWHVHDGGGTSHPRIAAVTPAPAPWCGVEGDGEHERRPCPRGRLRGPALRRWQLRSDRRVAIPRLAAVSQSTGAVDTAFVPNPNGTVRALALPDDGSKVYAGGGFSVIGGGARPGVRAEHRVGIGHLVRAERRRRRHLHGRGAHDDCSSAPPPTARGPTTLRTGRAAVPDPHRRRRPGHPRHG